VKTGNEGREEEWWRSEDLPAMTVLMHSYNSDMADVLNRQI